MKRSTLPFTRGVYGGVVLCWIPNHRSTRWKRPDWKTLALSVITARTRMPIRR